MRNALTTLAISGMLLSTPLASSLRAQDGRPVGERAAKQAEAEVDRETNHEDAPGRVTERQSERQSERAGTPARDTARSRQREARQPADQRQRVTRTNLSLEPRGWVKIATDYDLDGRFDATETIYVYDLEEARRQSRERVARSRQNRMRPDYNAPRPDMPRDEARQDRDPIRIQGTLQKTKNIDLVGDNEDDIVVGRIRTDAGRLVSAYFGPVDRVSKLKLKKGSEVTVQGVRSMINDEPFVIGRKVIAGEKSITNRMPARSKLTPFWGRIKDLRTTTFRGYDGEFLVAVLHTDEGRKEQINLGRKSELKKLELEEGDSISVLAEPGNVNGKPAVIAQLVRSGEQVVDVRERTQRNLPREDR